MAYGIFEPLIVRLRTEQIIEVRGASAASSSSYRYALTDLGPQRARCSISKSTCTPAPCR